MSHPAKSDKIKIYDHIKSLSAIRKDSISQLIQSINNPNGVAINWDGFQTVLDVISPITNGTLSDLIIRRTHQDTGPHSILVPMLHNYLSGGFGQVVQYELDRGESIDNATRKTARFVYTTAKYQLVKYLGVFNVMYKYIRSVEKKADFEETAGVDRLLAKLEYNAITDIGRKVSDYGVPERVLRFYEEDRKHSIERSFDDFERKVFRNVENIVNKE